MSIILDATFSVADLEAIYLRLAKLPSNFSDLEMSNGEDDPRYPVTLDALARGKNLPVDPTGGYFLHAKDVTYGVSFFEDEVTIFAICSSDETASELMKALAEIPVKYGFACQSEEREHQNRVVAKKPYGSHEAWVGRDYNRYLPGIYWLNLVPKSLLERHGVPESAIKSIAVSCAEIGGRNYLIRLYPTSSDWEKHVAEIDEWRKKSPGVFYKQEAEIALKEASNFLESSDATSKWK